MDHVKRSAQRGEIIKTIYQIHGHTLEAVDSSKYFGATISKDLTWKKYTLIIQSPRLIKLSALSDELDLEDCTAPMKSDAYTTVVRPVLEYSSTVWHPHQTSGTSPAQSCLLRSSTLHRTNTRMYHQYGPKPWMGVSTA